MRKHDHIDRTVEVTRDASPDTPLQIGAAPRDKVPEDARPFAAKLGRQAEQAKQAKKGS